MLLKLYKTPIIYRNQIITYFWTNTTGNNPVGEVNRENNMVYIIKHNQKHLFLYSLPTRVLSKNFTKIFLGSKSSIGMQPKVLEETKTISINTGISIVQQANFRKSHIL